LLDCSTPFYLTMQAATKSGVGKIVVAGGLAANSSLRQRMKEETDKRGITLYSPAMGLFIYNPAMIALAGYLHYKNGEISNLDLNPRLSMPL
jgi:N6-L-threonylcarbamoyladenine synthase